MCSQNTKISVLKLGALYEYISIGVRTQIYFFINSLALSILFFYDGRFSLLSMASQDRSDERRVGMAKSGELLSSESKCMETSTTRLEFLGASIFVAMIGRLLLAPDFALQVVTTK